MPIRICRPPKKPKPHARRVCSRAPTPCCRYPCCSAWLQHRTWHWCGDAIGELREGKARAHPVVLALAEALRAHDLPQALFDQMIDAREWDLDEMPFPDMASLETYADATSGNLMRLAARILGAGG